MSGYSYWGSVCSKCRFYIPCTKLSQYGYAATSGYCSLSGDSKYPGAYCTKSEGYEELEQKTQEE